MINDYPLYQLEPTNFPPRLANLHNKPERLYCQGAPILELLKHKSVTVVGSRSVTHYGETVTRNLTRDIAGQGIVIISGLAFGADSIAHEACLDAGGLTIAVLAGGLDRISPRSHIGLARRILEQGGALVSEQPPSTESFRQNFISRNRIMTSLADAVLVTEADEYSGSTRSADFTLKQSGKLMVVPGNITSRTSKGTNKYLRQGVAHCILESKDILNVLDIHPHKTNVSNVKGRNPAEQTVLDLLKYGESRGDILLRKSKLDIGLFNQTLTMLEIHSKVRSLGGNNWALY